MLESLQFSTINTSDNLAIGRAVLNVPHKLNVLTKEMVIKLKEQLELWQKDNNVAAVVIEGAGTKAFCAGGDVVEVVNTAREGASVLDTAPFFINEYSLDYLIHTSPKPVFVCGSGIVMGGGIGLFNGAQYRIVSKDTMLAMPEITIGLFPDVAGTWFLNRMPGRCGLFVGLTGARLNAADAFYLQLADHYIPDLDSEKLIRALSQLKWTETTTIENQIENTLNELGSTHPGTDMKCMMHHHMGVISEICDSDSPQEFASRFKALDIDDPWLHQCRKTFELGSPFSACVIWEQINRGRMLDLVSVFQTELNMATNMTNHADFSEGVRALLIEKCGKPEWTWKTVEDVDPETVNAMFNSPWDENEHPFRNLQ